MRHEQDPLPGEAPGPPGRPPLPGPVYGVGGALHPGPPGVRGLLRLHRRQLRLYPGEHPALLRLHLHGVPGGRLLPGGADLPADLLAVPEAGHHLHPGVPGAGLSPGLHHGPGQAPHPEDLPHHHHDPHVDELPHPHLRLDDHSPGHGDLQQLPHPPPPAQHPHHRHGGRRGHRHGL